MACLYIGVSVSGPGFALTHRKPVFRSCDEIYVIPSHFMMLINLNYHSGPRPRILRYETGLGLFFEFFFSDWMYMWDLDSLIEAFLSPLDTSFAVWDLNRCFSGGPMSGLNVTESYIPISHLIMIGPQITIRTWVQFLKNPYMTQIFLKLFESASGTWIP